MQRIVIAICFLLQLAAGFRPFSSPGLKVNAKSHHLKTRTNDLEMQSFPKEKVVVTGLGVISPAGSTVSVFFDNICQGNSGIGKLTRFNPEPFKCQIAGRVSYFI